MSKLMKEMLIYFLSGCDMTYTQDANDGYGFGCDGEDKTPFVFCSKTFIGAAQIPSARQ